MSKSKLHQIIRLVTIVCLSFVLAGTGTVSAFAATLEELKAQQETLQIQKEETDTKLTELKTDTAQKTLYRDTLYQQIDTVQNQLTLLRQEIDGYNQKIQEKETLVAEKQMEIDANFALLKERIRAIYINGGDTTTIALVLNSQSWKDLSDRAEVIKAVAQNDQELIDQLTAQMQIIQTEITAIDADKAALSDKKKELDEKNTELSGLYSEAQTMVAEAQEKEAAVQSSAEKLGTEIEENEAAIQALEEELKAQGLSGGGQTVPSGGYAGTGNFIWPMPGYTYLTCYFGDGGHRGADIAGGDIYGKPIVAADSGTVIYAGWNDSYGYCVFIDHGNGYETRYAHMSELGISSGAVSQGQVIGYAGSTGNSTGPHLHFEVIQNGELTDPMGYF